MNKNVNESELEAIFEDKISKGEMISPLDWMPERYRRQLIRMMGQHAHSEVVGMLPEANWLSRAPSLQRKITLLAKVQDEGGHGLYIYSAAETLGVDRSEMIRELLDGKAKYSSVFNYPTLNWADMGAIGWLVDGAAIINQTMLAKCSYAPYAQAMIRICKEENFHQKQGQELLTSMAQGTVEQKAMAQDAVNRWWWPSLMMFGPSDSESPNSADLMRWRIKLKSNDELRMKFVNLLVPQLEKIGLTVPDKDLSWDETISSYKIGEIPWDEFFDVIKGNGPMNKKRLEDKRKAHEEGEWVRVAAHAFDQKKESH